MQLDWGVIARNWQLLGQGAVYTASVTIVAATFGILFGTILALGRVSSSGTISRVAAVYVVFFRSVPLVQVLLIFYLFAPILAKMLLGIRLILGAGVSAYIAFSFFEAAYFAEIVRAGIRSVAPGQLSAATSLGLPYNQAMRSVVLPQAFRNVIPILLTQTIILFQDVSLVYAVGAIDFFGAAEHVVATEFRPVEIYLFVAFAYFVACFGLSQIVGVLQRRLTQNLGQVGANL